MSDDLEFVETLVEEVLDLLSPLESSFSSLDGVSALLLSLGWVPPTAAATLTSVQDVLGSFIDVGSIGSAFDDFTDEPGIDSAGGLLDTVGRALANFQVPDPATVVSQLPAPFNSGAFWGEFLRQLGDGLFVDWLRRRQPRVFAVAHLLGVIDVRATSPTAAGRVSYVRQRVEWESLGRLLSQPDILLTTAYGWGGSFEADLFLDRLALALVALGVPAAGRSAPAALSDRFWGSRVPPAELRSVEVPLVREGEQDQPDRIDLSLEIVPVPAKQPPAGPDRWVGIALVPLLNGTAGIDEPLSADFRFQANATLTGLTGPAVEIRPGGAPELTMPGALPTVDLGAAVVGRPATPFLLLGSRTGHRVELKAFGFGVDLRDALRTPELRVRGALEGLAVTIQLAEGDGFLNKIFGTKPQTMRADAAIVWSSRTGVSFEGQAALRLILPINQALGPIEVQQILLELSANTGGTIRIAGALTAKAVLGPVAGSVEEIGVALTLAPDSKRPAIGGLGASWGFLPPKGLSLRIAAGPVTGGGYLYCDPDAGQYAGAVELSFKFLSLKAIGLLNTKFPDGRPGFSLLIIIAAEFTPIQLGFGFTLIGVGGLLGINRTMNTEALRSGVKQRTLDAILFPKDPAANAPALIAALRAVFPPAEGRFTFGPMVKIGWGPTSLLEIEAALILELPMPIRLAILGRISATLPDKKVAIAQLRLDVVGIVDFDRGQISVDASLVDSRLAIFVLTGDMALRIGWLADKTFALAAGGFNPRFTPPPSFPKLDRLAISLASEENLRVRLESYFALTANTVQFGARLDLYAGYETFVGKFSAAAWASIDAMVQFDPFGFVADLDIGFMVAHNDNPFIGARLKASLSGPNPWHVEGFVSFDFFGHWEIPIRYDSGATEQPLLPTVDLAPELVGAAEAADAWSAELPDAAGLLVTLRAGAPGLAGLVHPLGALTVRQRLLPLELEIARFGQAVPRPGTATTFAVTETALTVDGQRLAATARADLTPTTDDFAPGQFLDLTDDEKLARPAFESMPSGVRVGMADARWPQESDADRSPLGVSVDLDYEVQVIDAAPDRGWQTRDAKPATARLEDWLVDGLVVGGAAANSARVTELGRYAGADQRIRMQPERYVVSGRDALAAAGAPTSYAQAVAAAGPGQQVVTLAEVAP